LLFALRTDRHGVFLLFALRTDRHGVFLLFALSDSKLFLIQKWKRISSAERM